MDSADISEWINNFSDRYDLSNDDEQKLLDVFGSLQDTSDSALKILVPLLLAYCNVDDLYKATERYIIAQISEDKRLKITVNIPINDLAITPSEIGGLIA